MPRGVKKTHSERMEEIRMEEEWLSRQKPLKSSCLEGRRRHEFGRGVGLIYKKCRWCKKTREQIKMEQRRK